MKLTESRRKNKQQSTSFGNVNVLLTTTPFLIVTENDNANSDENINNSENDMDSNSNMWQNLECNKKRTKQEL